MVNPTRAVPDGWVIWCGVRITRRKFYYLVEDPAGDIAFRSKDLFDCVEFLEAEDIEAYTLQPSEPLKGSRVAALTAWKAT